MPAQPTAPTIHRIETSGSRYRFDSLQHGDGIEVESVPGAQEMFRRWKKISGRRGRLVPSRDNSKLLFFLDDDTVV